MSLTLDFFDGKPPGEGTRYIIRKHLDKLVKGILQDIHYLTLKANLKEKCLCQLYNLIVWAVDRIKPHAN